MTVTINGSGTMTGLAVGGLNDNIITPAELSTGAPSWNPSGNLSFNSGYGSVATAYGCRAWVNFNGTGAVAIRASGNVSSITDNGAGDYTVNFTAAMPDANFSCGAATGNPIMAGGTYAGQITNAGRQTTSSFRILNFTSSGNQDSEQTSAFAFR